MKAKIVKMEKIIYGKLNGRMTDSGLTNVTKAGPAYAKLQNATPITKGLKRQQSFTGDPGSKSMYRSSSNVLRKR